MDTTRLVAAGIEDHDKRSDTADDLMMIVKGLQWMPQLRRMVVALVGKEIMRYRSHPDEYVRMYTGEIFRKGA